MSKEPPLNEILQAAIEAGRTTKESVLKQGRKRLDCLCRGVYIYTAWESGYHPKEIAERIGRSRTCCYTLLKRQIGYMRLKDKEATGLYAKIKEILKTKGYGKQ